MIRAGGAVEEDSPRGRDISWTQIWTQV